MNCEEISEAYQSILNDDFFIDLEKFVEESNNSNNNQSMGHLSIQEQEAVNNIAGQINNYAMSYNSNMDVTQNVQYDYYNYCENNPLPITEQFADAKHDNISYKASTSHMDISSSIQSTLPACATINHDHMYNQRRRKRFRMDKHSLNGNNTFQPINYAIFNTFMYGLNDKDIITKSEDIGFSIKNSNFNYTWNMSDIRNLKVIDLRTVKNESSKTIENNIPFIFYILEYGFSEVNRHGRPRFLGLEKRHEYKHRTEFITSSLNNGTHRTEFLYENFYAYEGFVVYSFKHSIAIKYENKIILLEPSTNNHLNYLYISRAAMREMFLISKSRIFLFGIKAVSGATAQLTQLHKRKILHSIRIK